ncbi:hypothetical protein ACHQM5_028467 [Ranunculus cassubicifolius]
MAFLKVSLRVCFLFCQHNGVKGGVTPTEFKVFQISLVGQSTLKLIGLDGILSMVQTLFIAPCRSTNCR